MKNTYGFVLGNNKTLNTLDILKVLEKLGISFEILESSSEIIIFKTNSILPENLIDQLGSAQKIFEIYKIIPDNFENIFLDFTKQKQFESFFIPDEVKISFGISLYRAGGEMYEKIVHKISFYCQEIKNIFNNEKRKFGFLFIKEAALSSVSVKKNGLLDKGFELVIVDGKSGVYIGKTISVQDFEDYSFRDFGRPRRAVRSGMIPPKLAKMMINLAGKEKNAKILDPFCGSGTILQEAILLGYQNIYGSDIEEKAVEDCRKNINWLYEKYPQIIKEDLNLDVKKIDASKLSDIFSLNFFDAIITEPFLGSPKIKYFQKDKAEKEVRFLEELFFQAFKEFKKILKDDGNVVIIFPVFNFENKTYYLDLKRIQKLGFVAKDLIEKEKYPLLDLDFTLRNSVIFSRENQIVWREVFVFGKK